MSSVIIQLLFRLFSKPNVKPNIKCPRYNKTQERPAGISPIRKNLVQKIERNDTTSNDEIHLTVLLVNYFMTRFLANCSYSISLWVTFTVLLKVCYFAFFYLLFLFVSLSIICCCFLAVSTLYYATVRVAPISDGVQIKSNQNQNHFIFPQPNTIHAFIR